MSQVKRYDPSIPLTPEQQEAIAAREAARRKTMADNPPTVHGFTSFHIYAQWGWKGCGFGEIYAKMDPDTGEWTIDTESMSPESVRKILYAAVDRFVDVELPKHGSLT